MRKGGLHLVIRCVQVSFGANSESVRDPFRVRSGSVLGPFKSVRDPLGVRSESVQDLFELRSGPFGVFGVRSGLFGLCSGSVCDPNGKITNLLVPKCTPKCR